MITNPVKVIEDIVLNEVQHDIGNKITIDDSQTYSDSFDIHGGDDATVIACEFTVHGKQVNSKKLIEDIASNCLLIPYIKDNILYFQSINPQPDPNLIDNGGDVTMYINQSDIISYTNQRTSPQKVYTKVRVNYNYDYGLKIFRHNTESNNTNSDTATEFFNLTDQGAGEGGYDISNFGLEAEQELIFDAHYIRTQESAHSLQQFLLLWHCNQHNILKLKLPLKYIQLKIGNYIGFDKAINDAKLFGEDYSIEHWLESNTVHRNGQQIYPVWMITSTNKTLTHIDVEMIQMHNLTEQALISEQYAPIINSFNLELIHPENQDNVIDNNIIIHDGTPITLGLSLDISDANDDDYTTIYSMLDTEAPYWLGFSIDYGLIRNDVQANLQETLPSDPLQSTATFEIPNFGGTSDWLEDWYDNASTGDWIRFGNNQTGIINAEVIEDTTSSLSTTGKLPMFYIHKDEIGEFVTYSLRPDWGMYSIPVAWDVSFPELFPGYIDNTIYYYDGTYMPSEPTPIAGRGYWVRRGAAWAEQTLPSPLLESLTITLTEGWNLIGATGYPTPITSVIDDFSIIVEGTLYEFQGTYQPAVTFEPGKGYWIRANADGEIYIPPPSG